jgi:hypothetical protein
VALLSNVRLGLNCRYCRAVSDDSKKALTTLTTAVADLDVVEEAEPVVVADPVQARRRRPSQPRVGPERPGADAIKPFLFVTK